MKRFLAMLIVLTAACTRVDVTEHCVMTRYGKVIEEKMETGLRWMPIASAECFPLIEQNWPASDKEVIEAQTADPVTLSGDVAVVYQYDPATVYEVFMEKRSQFASEVEIRNAIREGYRNAIAGWTVSQIFSSRRASLGDSVHVHIQRKLGDRATIKNVFIRDLRAPDQIEQARILAAQQEQVLDQARKQYQIDSVNSAANVVKAQAEARQAQLLAQAYAANQQLLQLKVAEALAEGLAKACTGTQTCVLGSSVMDMFMTRGRN